MSDQLDTAELGELTAKMQDGAASVAEQQRLQELFANPDARRYYVRRVLVSVLLAEEVGSISLGIAREEGDAFPASLDDAMIMPALHEEADADELPIVLPAPSTAEALIPQSSSSQRAWWRSPQLRTAAIIALPILVGIVLWSILRPAKPGGALVASASAVWGNAVQPPHDGQTLPAGPLQLASGFAQIRLNNGVSLVVEGPAHFEIQSQNSVSLELGKITVSVPPTAHGFTIQTPSSRTVDLGTEFGVIVDKKGNTETHVIRGTVEVTPSAGGASLLLSADHAARVDVGATSTRKIECHAGIFVQDVPAIDLVDLIAGGDGTQRLRDAGIDMADGSVPTAADSAALAKRARSRDIVGDGKFHRVAGRPLIGGVFVPHGATPDTLDPAGHRYTFSRTANHSFLYLWSGSLWNPERTKYQPSAVMGDVDYGQAGHAVMVLHANKGVAFDLDAVRAAHPDRPFTHFAAVCGNLTAADAPKGKVSDRSEFWVFVDGELRSHKLIHRTDPPSDVDVPIEREAHYLTLVSTDGEDGYEWDWVSLGDPRLK